MIKTQYVLLSTLAYIVSILAYTNSYNSNQKHLISYKPVLTNNVVFVLINRNDLFPFYKVFINM